MGLGGRPFFLGTNDNASHSVLSAIEGVQVVTPLFKPYVVPFGRRRVGRAFCYSGYGSGRVGRFFGPIIGS